MRRNKEEKERCGLNFPAPLTVNLSPSPTVSGEALADAVGYKTLKGFMPKEKPEPFLDVYFTEGKAEAVFRA